MSLTPASALPLLLTAGQNTCNFCIMHANTDYLAWLDEFSDSDDDIYAVYKLVERSWKHGCNYTEERYMSCMDKGKLYIAANDTQRDFLLLADGKAVETMLAHLDKLYISQGGVKQAYLYRHKQLA